MRSDVCSGIAPGGTETALLAKVSAAAAQKTDRHLVPAGNDLAAFILFAKAQRGQHVPTVCADLLIEEAYDVIRERWGLDPQQLQW